MKLLLDQNLSHRLIKSLATVYPGSSHVGLLGMGDATDQAVWDYAKSHGYAIVTLDADFHEFSLLWEGPPMIVWLKCGNQPKQAILNMLLDNSAAIERAYEDPQTWCVEVYASTRAQQ